jgi:hypothetical protein
VPSGPSGSGARSKPGEGESASQGRGFLHS